MSEEEAIPEPGSPTSVASRGVEELFEHYVEQDVVHGAAPDPADLCRDHPELLEPLREHIRDYRRLFRELTFPGDLETGRQLLHFRIVEKIGEGGMGQVYVAEDGKLGRRVALKVLAPEMSNDPERLERFRREARAVAASSHPNIVTVHSVEEADGIHFLTMELVGGTTLTRHLPPRGMPVERLFSVGIAIADALAAAHEQGITHRDLKPDNIMIDERRRVKVLDFGLAKRAPEQDANRETTLALTEDGRVLGTMPYMSPEQVMAREVDARSDIFSLGVILYEMATGGRPFPSTNPAELITSILRDDPTSVADARGDLPRHLARIVRRCLEKDPKRRYQSALDVRNELQDLWREIESGEMPTASAMRAVPRPRFGRRWLVAGAALAAAVFAVALGYLRPPVGEVEPEIAPVATAQPSETHRPSVAVLYFDNLKQNPDLEWLRHGLTDLVITDLSQSAEIDVMSSGRLHQILKELDGLEVRTPSFDLIQGIAERGSVQAVVRGSYARDGDVLRIAYTVEDTTTGAILKSDRIDSRGEESLFELVDELSAAVRNRFEVVEPVAAAAVQAVTTSSMEAWRLYSQGSELHRESKPEEAIVLLEKAVEIDPDFALALADLAKFHGNLGHATRAREYSRRAVELADRLPGELRYEIEAEHYGSSWSTLDRAIEAYGRALELDPEKTSVRNNLARRYLFLERYEAALDEFEKLFPVATFRGTFMDAANAYAALGRFETGYRILSDFVTDNPDDWLAQLGVGWHLTEWGRLDEARIAFDRAEALRPGDYFVAYARWRLEVLREDWQRASRMVERLAAFSDPFARWRAAVSAARNLTYQGRTGQALERLDEAIRMAEEPDAFTALAHSWKAELLLQRGQAALALEEAQLARARGAGEWPELAGLFFAALAEQELGRSAAADRLAATLAERWQDGPNVVEERQLAQLEGLLALARGQPEAATTALRRAEAMLPPRGVEVHWHVYPQHAAIRHALGRAELEAGRVEIARDWFERVTESGAEHLEQPVPFVRSFFFLGRACKTLGRSTAAALAYERFLEFWRDGDLDRERIEEALGASIRS